MKIFLDNSSDNKNEFKLQTPVTILELVDDLNTNNKYINKLYQNS